MPPAAPVFRAQPSHPWQRTAQLDAGLAKPDRGGKQEANGGKLAFIRAVQAFTCHGGRVARATPSFIQAAFTSHTGSLLLSSPKKVTSPFVPFVPRLPPLRHKKSETPIATQHRNKSLAISSRSGPCGRALTPSVAAKPPATPSYRAGVRNFASSPAWIAASPAAAAARAPCP